MFLHIYAKLSEPLSVFGDAIEMLQDDTEKMFVTIENRRSFREFDHQSAEADSNTAFIISALTSLGLNDADIATRINRLMQYSIPLAVCNIPSTYEYGISQPMNKAILATLLQSIESGNDKLITVSFKRSNSGRHKLPFPDNWDELYARWERKEISSKQFIAESGLKKATFYNLLTEYRQIQAENEEYLKRYILAR